MVSGSLSGGQWPVDLGTAYPARSTLRDKTAPDNRVCYKQTGMTSNEYAISPAKDEGVSVLACCVVGHPV